MRELDHGLGAVPRIVEEERPLGADRLELVALGQRRAAVEERVDVAREAHRAAEDPVRPARADVGLAVHRLGLAGEQARAAHAVAAHVHQAAALDVGAQADVVRVVERVAERGADDAQLADRAVADELDELRGLRVVPVHEGLGEQASGALAGVECGLDVRGAAR